MVKASNVYFVRSTKSREDEFLSIGGRPVWENFNSVFQAIEQLCGEGACRVFAEPNVKRRPDTEELNVAWFGSYDEEARSLDSLDKAMRTRILADLSACLDTLRPVLADAEWGDAVATMLNVFDDQSIMAVGEHAIMTNWGILPSSATLSQAAYANHIQDTIAPHLPSGIVPQVSALGLSFSRYDKTMVQPLPHVAPPPPPAAVTVVGPAQIVVVQQRQPWALVALASVLLLLLLLYVAWPGNLVYDKQESVSVASADEQQAIEDGLQQRIGDLRGQLARNACLANASLLSLPLNNPLPLPGAMSVPPAGAPDAGSAPGTQAPGSTVQGSSAPAVDGTRPPGPSTQTSPAPPASAAGSSPARSLAQTLDAGTVLVVVSKGDMIGTGSGFFVTPTDIMTNHHVVEGASDNVFVVSKILGRALKARIIATARDSEAGDADFALLRIEGAQPGVTPLTLATNVERMDNVIAAGFPAFVMEFDTVYQEILKGNPNDIARLDMAITQGNVISKPHAGAVQKIAHSASISPGNSGGPLTDACGRVVGINTFIISDREIPQKLNFSLAAGDASSFLRSAGVSANVSSEPCAPRAAPPAAPATARATP